MFKVVCDETNNTADCLRPAVYYKDLPKEMGIKVRYCGIPAHYKKLAILATEFFLQEYLDEKDKQQCVDLNVYCDPTLGDYGLTEQLFDDMYHVRITSKCNITVAGFLRTLFHELTHFRQLITGELKMGHLCVTYKKKTYSTIHMRSSALKNLNVPWEIEAYGVAEVAFLTFCQKMSVSNKEKPDLVALFLEHEADAFPKESGWQRAWAAGDLAGLKGV